MSFTEYKCLDPQDGEVAKALVVAARESRGSVEDFMVQFDEFIDMGRTFLDRVFPPGPVEDVPPYAAIEVFYVPPRYLMSAPSAVAALVVVDNLKRVFRVAKLFGPAMPPPDHQQLTDHIATAIVAAQG